MCWNSADSGPLICCPDLFKISPDVGAGLILYISHFLRSVLIQIGLIFVVCECFIRMSLVVDLVLQRSNHLFQQLCAFLDALVVCLCYNTRI